MKTDGMVVVKAVNDAMENKAECRIATAANVMQKILHITVTPNIDETPVIEEKVIIN